MTEYIDLSRGIEVLDNENYQTETCSCSRIGYHHLSLYYSAEPFCSQNDLRLR